MKRVGDVLRESKLQLNEALVLMSDLLRKDKSVLIAHPEMIIEPDTYAMWQKYRDRRISGEPLAYVLGYKEFYSIKFEVTPDVLVPRPESELIVDNALRFIESNIAQHKESMSILEIATGSGAIALALMNELVKRGLGDIVSITATDISERALEIARHNSEHLGLALDFLQGDLFEPVLGRRFDLIIANLPYIPHQEALENKYEPQLALDGGDQGNELINRFLQQVEGFLLSYGLVVFERYGGIIEKLEFDTITKHVS